MKNLILMLFLGWIMLSCNQNEVQPIVQTNDIQSAIDMPMENLSDFERQSLLLMREEEKLAHDVYSYLYKKWGLNVFNNISKSEQTHSEAVLAMLKKYNILDPVGSNPAGVFTNSDLQKLYAELTINGAESVTTALEVGATTEDLDIFDLMYAQEHMDNQDIKQVYANLTKGSRNHIRSFVARLRDYGISYKAQFIDADLLVDILNSPMETGGN